jgi:tetratricopeptide (TPR) repeat protein
MKIKNINIMPLTSFLLAAIIIYLNGILSAEPTSEADIFKKSVAYFFQKKYEMAELMLQQLIQKNPEHALAYSYLGDIFLKKKNYDNALTLYKRSIDLNPNDGENYFRIGQAYYYKKLGGLAKNNFRRALQLDPKLKFCYFHIGLAYLMLDRDKNGTIKNWETYIRIAPEDPQYEKIQRAIELLKDPNFKIPPQGSEITVEEALLLGGLTIENINRESRDRQADHEDKKTKDKIEEIYTDDDL